MQAPGGKLPDVIFRQTVGDASLRDTALLTANVRRNGESLAFWCVDRGDRPVRGRAAASTGGERTCGGAVGRVSVRPGEGGLLERPLRCTSSSRASCSPCVRSFVAVAFGCL